MCLSNEGLSQPETAEMIRQVRLGRAIGEMYAAAQGISPWAYHKAIEAMQVYPLTSPTARWRAFGFNQVMKKYHLKVRV